jgi:hypothetical protein
MVEPVPNPEIVGCLHDLRFIPPTAAVDQFGAKEDDDWFKPHPDRPVAPPRQRKPGEELWRVRLPDGRAHVCELRNDATAGAGWDFQILDGSELLVSRRCESEQHARRVAEMAKGDYLQ